MGFERRKIVETPTDPDAIPGSKERMISEIFTLMNLVNTKTKVGSERASEIDSLATARPSTCWLMSIAIKK